MSSYGELIQALQVLKNVKEKRHGIKTLASLCANRQFQVRIVQAGGWKAAILPLIISLDDDCRKYAALGIANLSYETRTHPQLLSEDVLKHLVPILPQEECPEVVIYVLNALGNFSSSPMMWPGLQEMRTASNVVSCLTKTTREETKLNCLFCLANMTEDPFQRNWMMENQTYEVVWELLQHLSYTMREFAMATLRGLSVEPSAQEVFPKIGMLPVLIGIFQTSQPVTMRNLALDILLHMSYLPTNAEELMHPNLMQIIEDFSKDYTLPDFVPKSIAVIANLCENVDLHDRLVESKLFEVLNNHMLDETMEIRLHIYRAMMHLSLSPRYHHIVLSTGAVANACHVAMIDSLPIQLRANVLQMMGAVCATHPSTPTSNDVLDLLHLVCTEDEHYEVRRGAALVLANASSDDLNKDKLLQKPFIQVLVIALSKAYDPVLTDYLMQFFHNICKLDPRSGPMLIQAGYHKHMFTFDRLESLTIASAVYLADTLRHIVADAEVREMVMNEQIFVTLADAWVTYLQDPKVMPHLALMCSAFAYYEDVHQEFVLQGGVRMVQSLYTDSTVEHVRLCCILTLLYLTESTHSQRAIVQERGMRMLLHACENETHIDLITHALKALIPFASSDDFRPQLGLDGALDTFASFIFSDEVSLQQLGVFLLQNLLELRSNRHIFLGFAEEKKCEEDYMEPMSRFLPVVTKGPPGKGGKIKKAKKPKLGNQDEEECFLSVHDPFIVRSVIQCFALLSLEHRDDVHTRFNNLALPQTLYSLFYSGHIDRSAGEAIVLFFANAMHGEYEAQKGFMRGQIDVVGILLCCAEMGFSSHANVRCLSALLCVTRQPDFRRLVLGHVDLVMAGINTNLNGEARDEDFFSAAALQCAILSELAHAPPDTHEHLVKVSVVEAFLVFVTVAGRGQNDEICIELLISAVLGISTLVASPTQGIAFMRSLLFPSPRLQLFMSLLRLPAEDIDSTFHAGTIGIRTLQRVMFPAIHANELYIDHLSQAEFLDLCQIRPSNFIYRHVIRTMCLLLGDETTRGNVLNAISPQNIVPTCLFALQGSSDVFVEVFGYVLVSNFCYERSLVPAFVSNPAICNQVLDCCRKAAMVTNGEAPAEAAGTDPMTLFLRGNPNWSAKQVAKKKVMLSMIMLGNAAESAKEKYRVGSHADDDGDASLGLTTENRVFLKKLSAVCLRDFETETLLEASPITDVQEYTGLLRLMVLHNSVLASIGRDGITKGGFLPHVDLADERRRRPTAEQRVLPELRGEFRKIGNVQQKSDGLLQLVDRIIEAEGSRKLAICIMETLTGMAYVSPLIVSSPYKVFQILNHCPEWLQSNLCLLLANTLADGVLCDPEADDWKEKDEFLDSPSDHLFPLLSTSSLETRNYTLGFLANLAPQKEFLGFIINAGALKVLKALPSRAYFSQHFSLMVESVRMLCNISNNNKAHMELATADICAFLRDALKHVAALLHSGVTSHHNEKAETVYAPVAVEFTEDHPPPLGMRIRWVQPAEIMEILPNTPAARMTETLQVGDELMEVNGLDVSDMEQQNIMHFFEDRPLRLTFRRKLETNFSFLQKKTEIDYALKVEELDSVNFYGSRDEYLQCFHMALLAIHNMATTTDTHKKLLNDPSILNMFIELIPSEIVTPALRRLLFSALTSFAQRKDVAGPVFYAMSDYFQTCEQADPSLQKYIMLCANLFYTSMGSDQIKPDRSMLVFVGRLADMQSATDSAYAVVEILHGMARAPPEVRGPFVCRETMVLTQDFMDNQDLYDVQLRAFEAAYFITMGNCDPLLWAQIDLIPRMLRTCGEAHRKGQDLGGDKPAQADGLFELAMRMFDMCKDFEGFVRHVGHTPELDRYLMDLLCARDKPPYMIEVASHLMAGLLRSNCKSSIWQRWKTLGVVSKIAAWFQSYAEMRRGNDEDRAMRNHEFERGGGGKDVDQMLNFLVWAHEVDPSIVAMLVGADVCYSISTRILHNAAIYQEIQTRDDLDHVEEMRIADANNSFRCIAQILTAMAASADGLVALSKLGLEVPLVELLRLPKDDFRVPALLMLCTLTTDKGSCSRLINSHDFQEVLSNDVLRALENPGSEPPWDEIEYFACFLDRICCHKDLALVIPNEVLHLLSALVTKASTPDARLVAMRGISRCAYADPQLLELMPSNGASALHYIMAACRCLKLEGGEKGVVLSKQRMKAAFKETQTQAPEKARMMAHFARAILAEAVSVSRIVCASVFADFDGLSMLDYVAECFELAVERTTVGRERQDVVCAELFNELASLLHVTLCCSFRQGSAEEDKLFEGVEKGSEEAKCHVDVIVRILKGVHSFLQLGWEAYNQKDKQQAMSEMLVEDIRVLYYVTALLHELCAKDLHSAFVAAVRTQAFCNVLSASIRLAQRRYQLERRGPKPRDLYAGKQGTGMFLSPMADFLNDFRLPDVFEHILVCMRHLLVQAMYVPPEASQGVGAAWGWIAQEASQVHGEALSWLPEVVVRYEHTHPCLKLELVRYVCAVATFHEGPEAAVNLLPPGSPVSPVSMRPPTAEMSLAASADQLALFEAQSAPGTPASPSLAPGTPASPTAPFAMEDLPVPLLRAFSLVRKEVYAILLDALETTEDKEGKSVSRGDPCVRVIALLAVANLAEYERRYIKKSRKRLDIEGTERLCHLVPVVVNMLKGIAGLNSEVAISCMSHGMRFFSTCLIFGSQELAIAIYRCGVWEISQWLFDEFFCDEGRVRESSEYVRVLKGFLCFARNWICNACLMELHSTQLFNYKSAEMDEEGIAAYDMRAKVFDKALDPVPLLNCLVSVALKLTECKRTLPKVDELKDAVFQEMCSTYQTLFKRQETRGRIDWKKLDKAKFDDLLEVMHRHRRDRSGERDDTTMINTVYMITKLGYTFTRHHFPNFLMEVAYGPREGHSVLQDISAICCAIIFTGAQAKAGMVDLNKIVHNYADFIKSVSECLDLRMQLWHFRTVVQWCNKKNVLDDISVSPFSINFVVKATLFDLLGRYGVIFCHNLSVAHHQCMLEQAGSLATFCEAYRRLAPGVKCQGGEAERRMLRRLLLAIVRNVCNGAVKLDTGLHDEDLVAIVKFVDCVEEPDLPMYLSVLRTLCGVLRHERLAAALPLQGLAPLVDLCLREVLARSQNMTSASAPARDSTDLYNYKLGEEDEEDYYEDEEEEEGVASPAGAQPKLLGRIATSGALKKGRDKGLGKRPDLYRRARMNAAAQVVQSAALAEALGEDAAGAGPKKPASPGKGMSSQVDAARQLYIYSSVIEVLMHATFGEGRLEVGDAVDSAFENHSIATWLKTFKEQAQMCTKGLLRLPDSYVHCSAKLIWHGWSSNIFRPHFDPEPLKEIVADLVPFFMEWPNKDVHHLATEVCRCANLHQYQPVCDYLIKAHAKLPELAGIVLSSSLADNDAPLRPFQAAQYMKVFVELLRARSLGRGTLQRVVISIETGMLADHPVGFAAYMLQQEHSLLADLLEQLLLYSEAAYVRQAMAVTLTQTVGKHYKGPQEETDQFVLRILGLAPGLLEGEFTLFLPVLQRLCVLGGKRVQAPLLERQLHMRVARVLESEVIHLEHERVEIVNAEAHGTLPRAKEEKRRGMDMDPRVKMQWCLALFSVLAGNDLNGKEEQQADEKLKQDRHISHEKNAQFDTFVCVDLLPVLVRILRLSTEGFEASIVIFLISAVSASPCIAPHMPDILRLAERAFIPRIDHPSVDHDAAMRATNAAPAAAGAWKPLTVPDGKRLALGMRRCFVHLLGACGHLPVGNPALLASPPCFKFLRRQGLDPYLFEDPSAPLHCKLLTLAHMCSHVDAHAELQKAGVFDVLLEAAAQLSEEATKQPRDLRVVWLHAAMSLAKKSGPKLLSMPKAVKLFEDAFDQARGMMHDSLKLNVAYGLSLSLQCVAAIGASMCPLSAQPGFSKALRGKYTFFLLSVISSGQLASLRTAACEQLADVLSRGQDPEVCGSVLLSTPCARGFRQLIWGSSEPLALACSRLMLAFVHHATFGVHLHLLKHLDAVLSIMGEVSSTPERIFNLALLFVALTSKRHPVVVDVLIEQEGMQAFLSLGRSNQPSRREIVLKWLEAYGASLYEIDEIIEVFEISSLHGLLFVGGRCCLAAADAQELRRILFGLVKRRVDTWRKSAFGVADFLSEALINALVPMCELQPDLVAALLALIHELQTRGQMDPRELQVLERVWAGGHLPWLCKRMAHKSAAQMAAVKAQGLSSVPLGAAWERHADLVCAQGMALRLLWHMYDGHPVDFVEVAIKKECLTKNLKEILTFYFQLAWPMRETREVYEGTEAIILLSMYLALRVAQDANDDMKLKLIMQGMLGVTCVVLLPTPSEQLEYCQELKDRPPVPPDLDVMDPPEALVPDAKLMAGELTARLMSVKEAYQWVAEKRIAATSVSIFAQLYHWRTHLFTHQGSLSTLATVSVMERQATLYFALVYVLTVEWGFKNLGLGSMGAIAELCQEIWARHANPLMRHYALRIFGQLIQVEPIYVYILNDSGRAQLMETAVHQTFGSWDIRALRQVLYILTASLAFTVHLPVLPAATNRLVARALQDPGAREQSELLRAGGALRAGYAAERHLLRPKFLTQIIHWCEHPNGDTDALGDPYSRVWALWLVATLLTRQQPAAVALPKGATKPETTNTGGVVIFSKEMNGATLERRKKLLEAQSAAGLVVEAVVKDSESKVHCDVDWLKGDMSLGRVLAKMVGKTMSSEWATSRMISCMASARMLFELQHFLHAAVFTLDGQRTVRCLGATEKSLQLTSLLLISVVSCFQLPLQAQTIGDDFLGGFFQLQQKVIEGIANCGEGPYDMLAKWLHLPAGSLPCETHFRCLIAFMLGQCIMPPLAEAPSLRRGADEEAHALPDGPPRREAPPVALCPKPPQVFLEALAADTLREDQRLRRAQVRDKDCVTGPLYSTMLTHMLYALAVTVPLHTKAAAKSATVRGAAFSQLMKVQSIVAQNIPSHNLFDPADGAREKLFLYLRAVACIRGALQCIAASWLAPDSGEVVVSLEDEGGRDFVQYCAKHLHQSYTNKTALTRVLGTPWERLMLGQGPTATIAELLLKACATEDNLLEMGKIGGLQALHALGKYGESPAIRQQATLYLTKLAVLSA